MQAGKIRAIAICVCREGDRILVGEYYDSLKRQTFYRPLGGTIEFGERGKETVRREFREEIAAELDEVKYLGTLESIFIHEGKPGHEIVLVYTGRLADPALRQKELIEGDELGEPLKVVWKRPDEFGPGKPPVYPDGLLELLESK